MYKYVIIYFKYRQWKKKMASKIVKNVYFVVYMGSFFFFMKYHKILLISNIINMSEI